MPVLGGVCLGIFHTGNDLPYLQQAKEVGHVRIFPVSAQTLSHSLFPTPPLILSFLLSSDCFPAPFSGDTK